MVTQAFDPDDRLAPLTFRGAKLNLEVSQAVVGGPRLRMSTTGVTELTIDVADPGLQIAASGRLAPPAVVTYEDLRLVVAQYDLHGGPAGTGGLTVIARSEIARALKRRRGPLVMRNRSPSDFVVAEVQAVRGRSFVQASASRPVVSRDVREAGSQATGADEPSSWTTFRRFADELGFLVYEIGSDVFFGQPTWLADKLGAVRVGWGSGEPEQFRPLRTPVCSFSEDSLYERTVNLQLPPERSREVRTGKAIDLRGVPEPFNGRYLITEVETRLSGKTPLTVTGIHPRNPVPSNPTGAEGSDATVGGLGTGASGPQTALAFTAKALTQAGERYVFGAEANLSDPDPRAFDCSELVEWAAAQVGVRFVDGSSNQIAAIERAGRVISVEQAMRTRGALLWKPGHIAISLGDGRTIEARNSRVGVVVGRASDIRYVKGGLIPGMAY